MLSDSLVGHGLVSGLCLRIVSGLLLLSIDLGVSGGRLLIHGIGVGALGDEGLRDARLCGIVNLHVGLNFLLIAEEH